MYYRDQVVIHPNGYGEIVGRIKEMVIRGGENIYPREIEEILHQHPDVLEASGARFTNC
jgi:acyl-CoA synthetase (AMP-forming)/AMP-acid ligase II